jgi:hypothetical protein
LFVTELSWHEERLTRSKSVLALRNPQLEVSIALTMSWNGPSCLSRM